MLSGSRLTKKSAPSRAYDVTFVTWGMPIPVPVAAPADSFTLFGLPGSLCRFTKNEALFSQGEAAGFSYKILSGAVRLLRLTSDGRRQIIGFRLPGDVVGIECLSVSTMTAEAVAHVMAVRCSRARIDRAIEDNPKARAELPVLLRQEVADLQRHLVVLGCQTATERVASFLAQLAQRTRAQENSAIDMYVSRKDIADYVGLTLETVSRTLSELRRSGVVEFPKSRHLVIKSLERLRALTAEAA
jgi:CRP/FNR family nitrogen fixation transcriptional regulator